MTEDPIFVDALTTDFVIPIMGPPGVGKSTFVDTLCGFYAATVGHGLETCTTALLPVIIKPDTGPFQGRRLVIVDTPPFNSLSLTDSEILQRIADWLAKSYKRGMTLAGIIYLFESSQPPLSKTNIRDREIIRKLCGDQALSMVVVGTTKGESLSGEIVQNCEKALKGALWGGQPSQLSLVRQVLNTQDSAWEIVNQLAEGEREFKVLQIQRELIDQGISVNNTEAGRYVQGWGQKSVTSACLAFRRFTGFPRLVDKSSSLAEI